MKILIYSINSPPELVGIGKYNGEMAVWLKNNGHQVKIITAFPYYPSWKISNSYNSHLWKSEVIDGIDYFRCPLFVPPNPTGFKRTIHLFLLWSRLYLLLPQH